ncbi:hypothetical protein [Pedobacter gandavensis]|uniref:hypothetical protein n=1 Tax=Pedobacter gandavensis TaxID=2679963 RepID=UPI0029311EC9|nr:hypothetical protein [Pedobacter gandavensis]
MKKLVWGMSGLLLAANFAGAQSVVKELNDAPRMAVMVPLQVDLNVGPIVALPPLPPLPPMNHQDSNRQDDAEDPGKSKTFSKTFTVDAGDKLNISNKYGAVVIKTWDKREVKVDVDIKAYSKDADDAQRLLDETSIDAGKSGDQITFKTNIGIRDGRYGSQVKNGKVVWRREVKVNYVVYMPSNMPLTVSNQYGGLNIADFSGPISARVQYGSLVAGSLNSTNNYVNVQYGQTDIGHLNKGVIRQQYGASLKLGTVGTLELDAQYVGVAIGTIKGDAVIKQQYGNGLNIGSVSNLDLDAQYTNVNVATVNGNATIKQQYNNITIGTVNKLNINAQYTTVKLGSLKGDGNFNLSYNKLSVDNILPACRNLTVNANYTGISLGFASNFNSDFEVKTSYGGFKPGSNVDSRLVSENGSTKNYSGKIGNGGNGSINIRSNYGGITFN